MSWQDFVDGIVDTCRVTEAAIFGLDGNVWARSGDNFAVNEQEVRALLNGMQDPSQLYTNGFNIAGTRYVYLSGTDVLVRGRKNLDGVHCVKTNQAVIIATYEHPIKAEQTASVVESFGDYLKYYGY
jgi:profilin